MYHSVIFGDKNTYDDWHIVPSSRPLFSMPSMKGKFIELPGTDGSIDLSEAVTGYPVFANRTGTIEFIVLNGYGNWADRYSEIAEYLHGRKMRAVLEDDPDWFYEGRFSINEWRSEKDWSRIVIDYNVDPYKWSMLATNEPWLWDPFSFVNGVIGNGVYIDSSTIPPTIYQGADAFTHIEATGQELSFTVEETGTAPQMVTFTATGERGIILSIGQAGLESVSIAVGASATIPGLVLYRGKWLKNGFETIVTASPAAVEQEYEDVPALIGLGFRRGRM